MARTRSAARNRRFAPVAVMALMIGLLPVIATTVAAPAAAAPNDLTMSVVNARSSGSVVKGEPIAPDATYTWLITSDDLGNPNQPVAQCQNSSSTYPDTCDWPSVRQTPGAVPIIAQGTQATLNNTTALAGLASGKYLISVLAKGYTLGGAHFTVPLSAFPLVVPVQPNPVPLGSLRVRVFHDNAPVDATYEAGSETGAQGGQTSLAGFEAHLADVLGEVTTDWYGNPLCTNYKHIGGKVELDSSGAPVIDAADPGGHCLSSASGDIVVPNIGSNRYGVTLSKPGSKSSWVQTTTLEGAHDHDVWVINGDTGLDNELVIGGEPVPWVQFGYIEPKELPTATNTAHVRGQILAGLSYVGGNGGITIPGGTGTAGGKEGAPINRPWISMSDLGNGDQMVYTGRGATDGKFDIPNVPDGTYQLTAWDEEQDYILFSFNVTVTGHQDVDSGKNYLSGWMARIYGTVFVDTNENGKRDPGEQGIPGTSVTLRERDNSLIDQFTSAVKTNNSGDYTFKEAYPLTRWLILEHFNTRFAGTGVTVQGENDPTPTTFVGAGVDINVLPVLGLGGRVDWGVKPYAPGTNGGIVGTVSYDTTRNELDPAYAVAEDYQPGIPNILVHLFSVLKESDPSSASFGQPLLDARGLEQKGPELTAAYPSETWAAPRGCQARQWDGSPLTGLTFIPAGGLAANKTCAESPAMGFQARPSDTTPGAFGQTVNGNYGFATSDRNLYLPGDPDNPGYPAGYAATHATECAGVTSLCAPDGHDLPLNAVLADYGYQPQSLIPDDYIVTVDIPDNPVGGGKMYQVTREQDVNVFDGDTYLPQENFPTTMNPDTASAAVSGGNTTPPEAPPSQGNGFTPQCVGADQTVTVTNPNLEGVSPYQGTDRPLCDEKLVVLRGQSSVAPTFLMFTPTPLPTHFWGLTINDLGLSWDKRSIQYGEAQGIPHIPMGLYDFSGNLVDTVETDFNGFYEAIEPSTSSFNCPLPAGPCAGMYRFVGNDPGQPGAPNANYNPRYRTIATNFQAYPGLFTVTDTAPTQTGAVVVTPGTTSPVPVNCNVSNVTPEVFAVDKVTVAQSGSASARTVTARGKGFGDYSASRSRLSLVSEDGTTVSLAPSSWSNRVIRFIVPATSSGPLQLRIRNSESLLWSTSAITLHSTGPAYDPVVRRVGGPLPAAYPSIQAAINAGPNPAEAKRDSVFGRLVIVNPGPASAFNPLGGYLENPILDQRVKLQGFGPGGVYADGTQVYGSVIDGRAYDADGQSGTAWNNRAGQPHVGPTGVPDGAVVTVLARTTSQFSTDGTYTDGTARSPLGHAAIDGFRITGGYQQDVPGNINAITGGNRTGFGAPGAAVTQGGGVYVHAFARNLRISNNLVIGNSGSYGGGIRVGTPYALTTDNQNDDVAISYNRIRDNGGTNLAGGIGLFNGAQRYVIANNDICGNFSAEYGGGVSVYGFSPDGMVSGNRVWFNESYDEGGGLFFAGELPADPSSVSAGTGPQTITGNEIEANNANDDGGGLRLLQVNEAPYLITNNVIVDNVSTHEGGGIALDDAANVRITTTTVARNVSTATAVTSDGTAAPAGLSTAKHSDQLMHRLAQLGINGPDFSKPVLTDDVFWQNKAGTFDGTTVKGIGITGTGTQNFWDMGSTDGSGLLEPRRTILTQPNNGQISPPDITPTGINIRDTDVPITSTRTTAPWFDVISNGGGIFVNPYSVTIDVSTLRTFPAFRQSVIVVANVPPDRQGSYHLSGGSNPAVNLGTARFVYGGAIGDVDAPTTDIDGDVRYVGTPTATTPIDAGADER